MEVRRTINKIIEHAVTNGIGFIDKEVYRNEDTLNELDYHIAELRNKVELNDQYFFNGYLGFIDSSLASFTYRYYPMKTTLEIIVD